MQANPWQQQQQGSRCQVHAHKEQEAGGPCNIAVDMYVAAAEGPEQKQTIEHVKVVRGNFRPCHAPML
jgi:hypothetical protein